MISRKAVKKITKVSIYTVLIIISIPLLLFLALKNPKVQTLVVHEITEILSEKLNAKISIESVNYAFFNKLKISKIYIEDQKRDTLFYSSKIYVTLNKFNRKKRHISIGTAEIDDGKLNLRVDSNNILNLKFIIDAFASSDTTKKSKPYTFKVKNLKLDNFHFKFHKFNSGPKPEGMNYTDLDISQIFLNLKGITVNGDKITAKMANLSAHEKCGFVLNKLQADVNFSPSEIRLISPIINTPHSNIIASYIIFRFNGFADWTKYVDKVKMDVDFKNSLVDFKSIAYFAPVLNKWNLRGYLNGRVSGPVAALKSNHLQFTTGDSTSLDLKFLIKGLPNADQTIWKGNVNHLNTSGEEIGILLSSFIGQNSAAVSKILKNFGRLDLRASFNGRFSAFESSASVSTSIGNITASLNTTDQDLHTNGYKLAASATNTNIGKIIGNPQIGNATFTLNSEGSTNGRLVLKSQTDVQIPNIVYNNYEYKNTTATLTRSEKDYNYDISANDNNLSLTCNGDISTIDNTPQITASLNLTKINLHRLHFAKTDSISNIKGLFEAEVTGKSINSMNGQLSIEHATIFKGKESCSIGRSIIDVSNINEHKLTINSEAISGSIKGNSNLMDLKNAAAYFGGIYFPALFERKEQSIKSKLDSAGRTKNYTINLKVKEINDILHMFMPLKVANNTQLAGTINASTNDFDIKLTSPGIALGNKSLNKITLQAIGTPNNMQVNLVCGKYKMNKFYFNNINMMAIGLHNKINTTLSFNNNTSDTKNEGEIKFRTQFSKSPNDSHIITDFKVMKSSITFYDTPWTLGQASVRIDSTSINIEDLKLTNGNQKIAVAGVISENEDDQLHIITSNIDAQNFKSLFQNSGFDINGTLNGIATIKSMYHSPLFFSNITLNGAYINGHPIGSPHLISSWNDATKQITIESYNSESDFDTYRIAGTITPDTREIDMQVNVSKLRPFLLEPFTKGVISDMSGYLSADCTIKGKMSNPVFEGKGSLNNFKAKVDFLNTYYAIDAPISISRNAFSIKNDTIFDPQGHTALVNANITHRNLKDFKFDISIVPRDILALNTTSKQNQVFFGSAYATGLVKITGTPKNLLMDITAQTDKNTRIVIPLGNKTQIQDQSFISFDVPKQPSDDEEAETVAPPKTKSNLKINLNLFVTPDAEAVIVLDSGSGNLIKAQGNSNLTLEVDPSEGLFQMRGTYTIQKGSYRFSLLNLAAKEFIINSGSTITWSGDPTKASINVSATYKVRASLEPLLAGTGQGSNQRYNVNCNIELTGMLTNPTFKFNITLPDADPATNTLLQAALNTESQMQKQFISLLVLGSFYPDAASETNPNTPTVSFASKGMASDLLFNQLSNVVSQLLNNVDLGFNYKPATATTSQEFEVSFSTNLLNDWVTVNGNVDFADNTQSTGRGIAGNYDVEVRLDKKDRLKFKMFSNDEQDNLLNNYQTKNGVGILYQEQFDSVKDLFKRKKKKDKKSEDSTQKAATLPENKSEGSSSDKATED